MKNRLAFLGLTIFLLVLPWTTRGSLAATPPSHPIPIAASIFPLVDMTQRVGQDLVEVKVILPPGASPHTFDPTPKQMADFSKARLFIKVGAGLEFWADRLFRGGASKDLTILDLSQGMPLLRRLQDHDHEHQGQAEAPPQEKSSLHREEGADPHYWLDPILAQIMVERISQGLGTIDPGNRKVYMENAGRYREELEKLHQEIERRVKEFRVREYVTFHAAWNYFSKRYGLKVLGVIEEAPGREPGPRDIARMVKELKKFKTRIIFAEPQFNPKIAEVVAKEAGGTVLFLDPMGDPKNPEKSGYLRLMRYNLSQMDKAMR